MAVETYEEFMATYDPDGSRTTIIDLPSSASRASGESVSGFYVFRDVNGNVAIVNPLPMADYLDIDVHAFANGDDSSIGVMAMSDGKRGGLEDGPFDEKIIGWNAARLVALFIGPAEKA